MPTRKRIRRSKLETSVDSLVKNCVTELLNRNELGGLTTKEILSLLTSSYKFKAALMSSTQPMSHDDGTEDEEEEVQSPTNSLLAQLNKVRLS